MSSENAGEQIILFVVVSLLVGTLCRHFISSTKLPIPYTVLLLIVGLILGSIEFGLKGLGILGESIETVSGIDPKLFFAIFLPSLIFESAFSVNYHTMVTEITQALLLAGPGVIIATILTSLVGRYIFDYNWTWSVSLMFGAILSATDPVAVVALLRDLGTSKRLATLIEAESLLNDGTAFVFFILLRDRVVGTKSSIGEEIGTFFQLSFGGVVLGIVFGIITVFWLTHVFKNPQVETSITIALAYLCFWVSEATVLAVSGVLAVVFMGLFLSKYKTAVSPEVEGFLHHVWEQISYVANTIVFVLSGEIVAEKFFSNFFEARDFGYLILLYVLLHVIRAAVVFSLLPLMRRFGIFQVSNSEGIVLVAGGLRGAVSLALALLTELEEGIDEAVKDKIIFHVAGIVVLTLFINASLIQYLLEYLNLTKESKESDELFNIAKCFVDAEIEKSIGVLNTSMAFKGSDWTELKKFIPVFGKQDLQCSFSRNKRDSIVLLKRAKTTIGAERLALNELTRRTISSIQVSYKEQYEEGLLSRTAARILDETAECAIDSGCLETCWELLLPLMQWKLVTKFHDFIWFSLLKRAVLHFLIVPKIALSIELSDAFLEASEHSLREMASIRGANLSSSYTLVCDQVEELQSKARAKKVNIQTSFPKIAKAIRTRKAAKYLLKKQLVIVDELFRKGILEEKEVAKLTDRIDRQMHILRSSRPFTSQINEKNLDANRQILLSLPYFRHMTKSQLDSIIDAADGLQFKPNDVLFHSMDPHSGVYIIVGGVVDFVPDGMKKSNYLFFGPGSAIGLYSLVMLETRHMGTAKAHENSYVDALRIRKDDMEKLMQDSKFLIEVYRKVTDIVMKRFFFSFLARYTSLEITMFCEESTIHICDETRIQTTRTHSLLLKGGVWVSHSNFNEEFNSTDDPEFKSPLLMHPGGIYKIAAGAVLVLFPPKFQLLLEDHVTLPSSPRQGDNAVEVGHHIRASVSPLVSPRMSLHSMDNGLQRLEKPFQTDRSSLSRDDNFLTTKTYKPNSHIHRKMSLPNLKVGDLSGLGKRSTSPEGRMPRSRSKPRLSPELKLTDDSKDWFDLENPDSDEFKSFSSFD